MSKCRSGGSSSKNDRNESLAIAAPHFARLIGNDGEFHRASRGRRACVEDFTALAESHFFQQIDHVRFALIDNYHFLRKLLIRGEKSREAVLLC